MATRFFTLVGSCISASSAATANNSSGFHLQPISVCCTREGMALTILRETTAGKTSVKLSFAVPGGMTGLESGLVFFFFFWFQQSYLPIIQSSNR